MTPEIVCALASDAGQELLRAAAALGPTLARLPACRDRLSHRHPVGLAMAALETVLLRQKAVAKFRDANQMLFTRDGYEMASGTIISEYRARRFAGFGSVADLGSGIGGDSIALAAGHGPTAFEADPVHHAITQANLQALGLTGTVTLGDYLAHDLARFDAAFADPSRRSSGVRTLDPESGTPPISHVLAKFPPGFPLAAKVAPGLPRDALCRYDAEAEFISVAGELKECVLWFGPLKTATARATLLPGGHTLTGDPSVTAPISELGEYLYDPDSAISRAGLVGTLALQLGLHAATPGGAMLTGDLRETPLADRYRIEAVFPPQPQPVIDHLRARGVGRVTPLKRGMAVDTDEFVRRLKLAGSGHRHLVFLKVGGTARLAVAEPAGLN